MPYIYKITNNINNKIYIGKTVGTVEKRWKEHIKDYKKRTCEKRPLYRAMNKYGVECFSIEIVEEVKDQTLLNDRERFWIEYFGSFKNGYNATTGGDGKSYIDYDLVVATYRETQSEIKTAEIMNIHPSTVRYILKAKKEPTLTKLEANLKATGKIVNQYTKEGQYIQSFPSARSAAESLGKTTATSNGASSHITDVCRGKRQTAYGFKWKFAENIN